MTSFNELKTSLKIAVNKWIDKDNALYEDKSGKKNKCKILKINSHSIEFIGLDRNVLTEDELREFRLEATSTGVICSTGGRQRKKWDTQDFIRIFKPA
jgi:hypothetical protein